MQKIENAEVQEITIRVILPDGRTIVITTDAEKTIGDIKQKIAEQEQALELRNVQVWFDGLMLIESRTVRDCRITSGSHIELRQSLRVFYLLIYYF